MPARKSGRVKQDAWAPEKNTFPRDLEELKTKYKVYAQTNEVLNDMKIVHSIRCRVSHEFWLKNRDRLETALSQLRTSAVWLCNCRNRNFICMFFLRPSLCDLQIYILLKIEFRLLDSNVIISVLHGRQTPLSQQTFKWKSRVNNGLCMENDKMIETKGHSSFLFFLKGKCNSISSWTNLSPVMQISSLVLHVATYTRLMCDS